MASNRRFASSRNIHALVAVAFLFVMLVEWGSHSLAFVHAAPITGLVSVGGSDAEHDDPCRTIVCCESRKNDQKAPGFTHDLFPYGSAIECAGIGRRLNGSSEVRPVPREAVDRIFRPKDPLLHPPEFS
jgi:hypothetical protein